MSLLREGEAVVIPQPVAVNQENGEIKITDKSRQCPICHVYYKNGNSYWQHVRYVHASFLSQCVICEKSYKRTTMAKHHVLHSHKIAWHLCGNYVRKIQKSDLMKNLEVKKETKNKSNSMKYFKKKTLHLVSCFNCYNCSGSFPTIHELFEHVKCHRGKEHCVELNGENLNELNEEDDDDNDDNDDNDDDDDDDDDGDQDEDESVQNYVDEMGEFENFEVENFDGMNHVICVLGIDGNHELDGMDDSG